jgi:hypothetical protein
MDVKLITEKEYLELIERIEKISDKIDKISIPETKAQKKWVDNIEAKQILKKSTRTMQALRDEGVLSFSKSGRKIYYKLEDIESYLQKNYRKAFQK